MRLLLAPKMTSFWLRRGQTDVYMAILDMALSRLISEYCCACKHAHCDRNPKQLAPVNLTRCVEKCSNKRENKVSSRPEQQSEDTKSCTHQLTQQPQQRHRTIITAGGRAAGHNRVFLFILTEQCVESNPTLQQRLEQCCWVDVNYAKSNARQTHQVDAHKHKTICMLTCCAPSGIDTSGGADRSKRESLDAERVKSQQRETWRLNLKE